jgi:hypothetical protein
MRVAGKTDSGTGGNVNKSLKWEVFVTPGIPTVTSDLGMTTAPGSLIETRQYIRDFDRVAGTMTTARGLYDKMLELYPDRINPGGALWLSARAAKPQ